MKSLKPIIICVAIVLVIALAFVLFVYVFPNSTPAEENTSSSGSPVISNSTTAGYIINQNYDDITSMEFLPAEGDSFRVDVLLDDDGNYSYTVTPATPYFEYSSSMLRSLCYTVAKVSAKEEITENADDLAAFGLDKPWFTVRSTYRDGSVVELYFGNNAVVDQDYYCKSNLSDQVFVIGKYTVQQLTRSELLYRDATLFPIYEEDDIYEMIEWVRLTLKDGTVFEISRDFDGTDDDNITTSMYVMHQPYAGSVNDDMFKTDVMDVIAPIEKIDILCDITEDQFAEYGFNRATRLEMRDVGGKELNLLIGATCENTTYTYAMIEGTYTVLIVETACLTWQDINPMEYLIRLGWMYPVSDVATVELNFRPEAFSSIYEELGTNYVIEMEHGTRETDSGKTVAAITATLNGEPLTEANCRRLYARMLYIRMIDVLPEGTDLSAEPDASFTITFQDGTTSTMELIPINDRDYAMVIDGKAEYYVYQKNLQNIVYGLKTNARGFELPKGVNDH